MYDLWKQWDSVHDESDQQKRQKSAQSAKLTPLSIDKETGKGVFKGSKEYSTGLDTCQCGDWISRRKPCKHMYRLAYELGLMDAELSTSPNAGKDWKDFVSDIEKASEGVQMWFADHLSAGKNIYNIKKEQAEELLSTGLFKQEKETPKQVRCILDPVLVEKWRNVSWYFKRKFHGCRERQYDDDSGIFIEVQKPLPDDSVTALLRKNGFAARWEQ